MKLLVCVDGSAESEKALKKTVEFASGCQIDKVTLMMVSERVAFPFIESAPSENPEIMESFNLMNDELLKQNERILEESAAWLRENGIDPELLLEEGHPAKTIIRVAEQNKYDLIIISGRGRAGVKTSMLGSVSNSVIQGTHVSVLVVK